MAPEISAFIILLLCYQCRSGSVSVSYDQAFERSNRSTTGENVYVDGYKTHSGSLSTITATATAICDGAFACSQALSIIAGNIGCGGTSSCLNVAKIQLQNQSNFDIYRHGANAMAFSTVNAPIIQTNPRSVTCDGEQSCAHSLITSFHSVNGFGAYSLLNAIITDADEIYFYGYYAGFGAQITCTQTQNCNIYCYGNGCTNVSLNCGNRCDIVTGNIYSTAADDVLLYDSLNTATQNDAACSAQRDSFNYDNDRENKNNSLVAAVSLGPICCRGYKSCYLSKIHYLSDSADIIVCSARQACELINITSTGAVFCSASESCYKSTIHTPEKVFCEGYQSCFRAAVESASSVFCSGYESCAEGTIASINGSSSSELHVYLTGHRSGDNATITCHKTHHCFIYCYAYDACSRITLECAGGCVVDCNETNLCPDGWTQMPTSVHPTVVPSRNPDVFLSVHPTVVPSRNPDVFLSVHPTFTRSTSTNTTQTTSNKVDSAEVQELSSTEHTANSSPLPSHHSTDEPSSIALATDTVGVTTNDAEAIEPQSISHLQVFIGVGTASLFCIVCVLVIAYRYYWRQPQMEAKPSSKPPQVRSRAASVSNEGMVRKQTDTVTPGAVTNNVFNVGAIMKGSVMMTRGQKANNVIAKNNDVALEEVEGEQGDNKNQIEMRYTNEGPSDYKDVIAD